MSSNLAEYAGVLQILKYLSYRPPGRVTIHGDSQLVISQLNGKWRMLKGLYLSIAKEAKALLAHLHNCGWEINLCWIPRAQNKECDALSKQACHTNEPDSTHRRVHKRRDPRDVLMLGRTVKTTGITVVRAAPKGGDGTSCNGRDWWVCKRRCGREFIAQGWNVRHGRTRDCESDEHIEQSDQSASQTEPSCSGVEVLERQSSSVNSLLVPCKAAGRNARLTPAG
jgi:hypothetical protein